MNSLNITLFNLSLNYMLSQGSNSSSLNKSDILTQLKFQWDQFRQKVSNLTSMFEFTANNVSPSNKETEEWFEYIYAVFALNHFKVTQFMHSWTYNLFTLLYLGEFLNVKDLDISEEIFLFNQSRNTAEVLLDLEIDLEVCGIGWPTDPSLSLAKHFLDIMKHYVNPTLSLFGICQNMLSFAILSKDGFRKTCNIFLLSVVIAGSFQQFLSLNIAGLIEHHLRRKLYVKIKRFVCMKKHYLVVEIFRLTCMFIGQWGQYVFSSTFMLITLERLVAVFIPFNLKFIVTKNKGIPLVCVLLGSLAIALRIKLMIARRSNLTSVIGKTEWSRQTTKTLLVTCSVFCFSEVFLYAVSYLAATSIQHSHTAGF
ncbi:G-protein coupled receptor [Biomphalaria glabrata]|nr:G-protein coupled receptor [Biomphalaria glabrata]